MTVTVCVCLEEMHKKLFASKEKEKDSAAAAYEHRFISQTAPAYSNKNHPYHRIVQTQKEGTVTRRTNDKNAPVRRRQNNYFEASDHPLAPQPPVTAPPLIAVTGMGGLRVIKAGRRN